MKTNNYKISDTLWGRITQYTSAVWDSWGKKKYLSILNILIRVFVFSLLFILVYYSIKPILVYFIVDDSNTMARKSLNYLIAYLISSRIYIYGIKLFKNMILRQFGPFRPLWEDSYKCFYEKGNLYFKLNYNSDYLILKRWNSQKNIGPNCGCFEYVAINILSIEKIKNIISMEKLPYRNKYDNNHEKIGSISANTGREGGEYGFLRRTILKLKYCIDLNKDDNTVIMEFDILASEIDKIKDRLDLYASLDIDIQKCLDRPLMVTYNIHIPTQKLSEQKLSESLLSLFLAKFHKTDFDILK